MSRRVDILSCGGIFGGGKRVMKWEKVVVAHLLLIYMVVIRKYGVSFGW